MKINRLTVLLAGIMFLPFFFSSCVSMKKHKEIANGYTQCKEERDKLQKQYDKLLDEFTELQVVSKKMITDLKQLTKENEKLTADLYYSNAELKENRLQMEALQLSSSQAAKGNEKEMRKLLDDLQKNKELQIQKEDELTKLSQELGVREKKLSDLQAKFAEKEKRVNELESILSKKDSVVQALRKSVNDALLGYIGKGLSVSMRNGKVYVSLEESLLFASGSWQVGPQGVEALKKLVKVLKENPDINIVVEGHTDNVPYHGASLVKDNWDLSVMRATAVSKIILANGDIKPSRLMAAGRSEYIPIDPANTKEARAKNRRTEIILTPKLDELLKIIEME